MLYVETYWTIEEPLDKDCSLFINAAPIRECNMPPYQVQEHEFLDDMWVVNRWKPGVIYRERIGLIPPAMNQLVNLNLQLTIKVRIDGQIIGEFNDPNLIKMRIPNLTYRHFYDREYDDIIYQSELGKCWTATQLEKVTGGKWLVPPPEGWYVNYFPRVSSTDIKPHSFLATTEIYSPESLKKALENLDKFEGVMIRREVAGFPPNFPVLKVANIPLAVKELGVAARKRFQGKVIAVTGSAGKTTTCNMLSYVFGKDHNITATWGSSNMYGVVPRVFAHVKQDDAYAIIELSVDALHQLPGSICYEIMPHIAVVTSISPAHIGNGTLERLATWKSKIFNGMSPGGYAILNRDMPCYEIFEEKAKSLNLNIITFGTHPESSIRMPILEDGGEFFVGERTYKLSCPVPTEQLYDALAVIGVAVVSGFAVEKTLEYLKTFEVLEGRGNILNVKRNGKNLRIIDSTFNANPVSIKYALQHLKNVELNKRSRVAILGDVAQLGNHSIELHEELAEPILDAEPDRTLLCGEFMRYPYERVKDKLNAIWFDSLDKLLKDVESHLRDGDTILIKSSHATELFKVVELLSGATPPRLTTPSSSPLNIPKPLFDVKDFLPDGITSAQNGKMPADKLKRIHCGGHLYIDAARSWLAMVRAAAQENVFLNLNNPFNAYRKIESQLGVFKGRFIPLDNQSDLAENAIRVEFEDKIWQLKSNANYAAIPGTSSHGYGLAVDIGNAGLSYVKPWLDKNAESFGFVKEYDFEPWHYTYIKCRESVPARVLEIESLPPEPIYTAEQIKNVSGCEWFTPPPTDWICNGMFYTRPLRAGFLAAVNQGQGIGISEQLIAVIFRQLAGLICTNPELLLKFNRPLLVTSNLRDTIEKLDAFCLPEKF